MASPTIDVSTALDFQAMTMEQLAAESLRIAGVLELCNNQRREIQQIVAMRKAQTEAQQRVAGLTQTQRDALLATLQGMTP